MAEIGQSNTISNLWPTPSGRAVDNSGRRGQSSQKKQHKDAQQGNTEKSDDEPGKNIDEYA